LEGRPFRFIAAWLSILAGFPISQALFPDLAQAACTVAGTPPTWTCSGTTNLGTTPLGNGPNGPDNATVTVVSGASVAAGNASAISLRDGAVITVQSGGSITSSGASGGSNGLWGAGKNTIEFRSHGTLTVGEGAAIRAIGTSTNAEAVNLIGEGNTVINHGTISAINTAAIWFEDQVIGDPNTIDNYGIVQRGNGSEQSVTANSIGSQRNADVHFINRTGAIVYGGLSFAGGNDVLTLFPSSIVTGGFNGGGGTNTLTLAGEAGSSDTIVGDISNFQQLTKTGQGTWTLAGQVGTNGGNAPLAVQVQQGTLVLTGNNTNFNGSVVVDPAGTLEARAQSLPPAVTDNGLVRFAQPDNGTYAGVISGAGAVVKTGGGVLTLSNANTYGGGTTIQGGTIAISADNQLGGASGPITLDGGMLELTSSFNLSSARVITVTANNGAIQTDAGVTSTVSQAIIGAGTLTKAGPGQLTFTASNTYSGGTTISGGTLQLGNGGTTGSIVGDVAMANDSALVFNRSNAYAFDGLISGSGSLTQAGAGTTTLSGNNTYTGPTSVSSGTLFVNGNQSGATGATTVASGARLSGGGTIGGNVTMADNSVFAPGSAPLLPGTLTINGSLVLGGNTNVFYNLVQAGVSGGALNDLAIVHGDLTLNGVINVLDQGQTFSPGVYRVFNYDGALTNQGLTIGTVLDAQQQPTGRTLDGFSVQTSIPGQVNLVNTAGLTLTYWDGDAGPKNSQINGGDGSWQATAGNDNWTTPSGTPNAPWESGAYAIFAGTPGTVVVDNSLGAVTSRGMQFMVDDYVVTGQPITLQDSTSGNVTYIRVGDGTSAGAAMTATISAQLTGAATVVKDDLGTLILTGANTYTGSTGIFGGTLQVSSDANLGTAGRVLIIVNGATLRTTGTFATNRPVILSNGDAGVSGGVIETAAGTQLTLNGTILEVSTLPPASLSKTGGGTLVVANTGTYTNGTTIAEGTLQLGSGGTTGSILGNVTNNGTLAFNRSNSYTFAGTIAGSGTLEQIGSGTTILTASNTYSGGTTISGGTLQLGNGGTTGSIVGDVTDNGTLAFNRSDTVSFDGIISGSGTVSQIGTGTTILTADSDYTGGTTISSGTLQLGNGGTSGSIVGNVNDNGNLVFNRSDTIVFPGDISGSGTLAQIGNGITVLTGTNTYAGGTTISAGTLQVGGGGTTGSIVGDVTNNSTLAFDRSDTLLFDGRVTGSGRLVQQGDGTTILTGSSTYGGGTVISAGTLQLGNGGDSGLIVGNVLNNGTLAVDRANLLTLAGEISGSGSFVQRGAGTTVLLGANSYGGATLVSSGSLYIDGDQSAATGLTTAASGGTLGGVGIIGGNVVIADGATLAPGDISATPGTLSINGNLMLSGNSTLRYKFGQASVVGGAFNDLTVVQGNLTLDGTLNVETSEGGSFDPGVYRVISYAGSMTNNGLTIGTIPSPDFFLQTSVDHQVNLINTVGLTFNYWDGAAGPKDDGTIDGGNGVWQNSAGNDNWTNELGVPNAAFANAAFAIFMAAPGTVVVDPSLGEVVAAGMQFASDGYEIQGGPITLVATPNLPAGAVIRVGDGSTLGAQFTATIRSPLLGDTTLVKTDLGTLILDADNAYTGGTAINGGVLQISRDANLGPAGTPLSLDGGTLRGTADIAMARNTTLGDFGGTFEAMAGTRLTQAGAISGEGSLTKTGDGTVVLTGTNTYAGGTFISAGTLQLGDGGTSGSIEGFIINESALVFNRSDLLLVPGSISGFGSVTQAGPGTTVLTGENRYTGGTTIADGTLQLGNGGAGGSIVGNVTDNGMLAFNRSDIYTFAGAISGTGSVSQIGAGTTILTGANIYGGPTLVRSGTLQAGAVDTFSPNSAFTVAAGARLDLSGFDQTVASLTNAGLVRLGAAANTRLTVPGAYVGQGGALQISTVLASDDSPSDRLVINGGTATGSTTMIVVNVGGGGAVTAGDGILVVDDITGHTTAPGAFHLGAPVVAGPYEYSLYRGGVSGGNANDWFLRSTLDCSSPGVCPPVPPTPTPQPPDYREEVSLYAAIPSLALAYGNVLLDSLDTRMGGQRAFPRLDPNGEPRGGDSLVWGRIIGLTGSRDGGDQGIYSDRGPSYDYRIFALQTGIDLYRAERREGGFDNAGLYFAYGRTTADVDHFDGTDAGTDTMDAWSVGAYWTRTGAAGWYLDAVLQGTWYDTKASGRLPTLTVRGFGLGASLEGGHPFHVGKGLVLEPQAQVTYQSIDFDDARDPGAQIRFEKVQSMAGRIGVRLSRAWDLGLAEDATADRRKALAWIRPSLVHEFMGRPDVEFSSASGYVPFRTEMHGTGFRIDGGFDVEVAKDAALYGALQFQRQFSHDDYLFGGELGLKVRF